MSSVGPGKGEALAAQRELGEVATAGASGATPGALGQELGIIRSLWRRDMLRLKRERSRWLGVIAQPVLFWAILGSGMASTFSLPGHPEVDYATYFYPGVLVMVLLFTTIFATISVIEDRRSGFLQAVMVAPGSRLSVVLGKTAGVTTLALGQVALLLVLAPLAGYGLGGVSWPALLAVVLLSSVGLTAGSLVVAWLLPTVQGYHAVMGVVMIPLWVLSGAMFPASGSWLASVLAANPMTYMVEGLRTALGGAPLASYRPGLGISLLVLTGFAGLTVGLAAWVTRRR
jgi:ABC-2 type transport system permease protein